MVYPGRFQPMLKHHAEVYQRLVKQYPDAEVYIGTSDKVEPGKSPFNFAEKRKIAQAHGIDPSRVLQVKNPYHMDSYPFDKDNTQVIFAVGEKDAAERFPVNRKKRDGTPGYYQRLGSDSEPLPMSKRGYIVVAPNVTDGGDVASASAFRQALQGARSPKEAKQIYVKQFGSYDPDVFNLIYNKVADKTMEQMELNQMRKLAGLSEAPSDANNMRSSYYGMSDQQRQLADMGRALMNSQFKYDDDLGNKMADVGSELTKFGTPEGAKTMEDMLQKLKMNQEDLLKFMKKAMELVDQGAHEMGRGMDSDDEPEQPEDDFDADADATQAVDDMEVDDEINEDDERPQFDPKYFSDEMASAIEDILAKNDGEGLVSIDDAISDLRKVDAEEVEKHEEFLRKMFRTYDLTMDENTLDLGDIKGDYGIAEAKCDCCKNDPCDCPPDCKGCNSMHEEADINEADGCPCCGNGPCRCAPDCQGCDCDSKTESQSEPTYEDNISELMHLAGIKTDTNYVTEFTGEVDPKKGENVGFGMVDKEDLDPIMDENPITDTDIAQKVKDMGASLDDERDFIKHLAHVAKELKLGKYVMDNPDFVPDVMMAFRSLDEEDLDEISVAGAMGSVAKGIGRHAMKNHASQIKDDEANEETVYQEDDSEDLLALFDLTDQETDEAIGDGFLSGNKALGAAMQDIEDEITETPESALETTIKELRALAGL